MPRLLALTADAALLDQLVELPEGWRIVAAGSVEEAAGRVGPEVSVAVVDLGDRDATAAAADRLARWWPDLPCLAIDVDELADHPTLRRGAGVADLHDRLRTVAGTTAPSEAAADPEPDPVVATTPAVAQEVPEPEAEPDVPPTDAEPAASVLAAEPVAVASDAVPPAAEPGTPDRAKTPAPSVPVPPLPLTPWSHERPRGRGRPAPRRRPERPAAPAAGSALARRLQARLLGGLGARDDAARDADRPVPERIQRTLPALADLAHLVADLPAVGALEAVGAALVAEITAHLDPDTISVLIDGDDGRYEVLASHGLTGSEQRMRVAPDHPVLADLTANVDAVMLAPLDEGRALVAGLAGARGDGLMAASLDVDTGPVAFVTVARAQPFTPKDLDRLRLIASEAAPAFALALALRRLRMEPSVAAGT